MINVNVTKGKVYITIQATTWYDNEVGY